MGKDRCKPVQYGFQANRNKRRSEPERHKGYGYGLRVDFAGKSGVPNRRRRIAPQSSQIFEAAKALRGQALLNDKPDQKYTSATDLWGYVEREQHENQKVYVKAGNEADWASSYLSDGKDKDEGLTYKLTLQPGRYKVWVAHVPNVKLNFTSYLRVNQKIYDTKQVSTTIAEDWVHPPVWVTHELKLAQPATFTYESNKIGGKEWENGSISLIAVEQVSANVEPPFISPSGGAFGEAKP